MQNPPDVLTTEEIKALDRMIDGDIEEGLHPSLHEVVKDDESDDSQD